MIGDLHVHTSRSDGSLSPKEAVLMARARGLDYIGLVDHDITAGLEEAVALGFRLGVAVIPGVEVSAYDFSRGRRVHLLGFMLSSPATSVELICEPIRSARDKLTRTQVAILEAAGYPITLDEVMAAASGASVLYKQHVMDVLIRKGLADDYYGRTYRELFGKGGTCAGEIAYADVFEALRAIHADGGLAILAHPGQLDSWELLDELLEAGLDGVELYHESHSLQDHRRVLAAARAHPGLLMTGGSDDHGRFGSLNAMGDIRAPHGALEAMGRRLESPFSFVEGLAREAGALLRAATAEVLDVVTKGGDRRDIVTRYDSLIQERLVAGIAARLPGQSFLAEEPELGVADGSDGESDASLHEGPTWIIDPIDGTTNFACTGRDFAISIALYDDGLPRYGLVYDVMADELYSATPGGGAFLNGSRLYPAGRAVSIEAALVDMSMDTVSILGGSMGAPGARLAMAGRGHRALGCASISICRIARGSLDVYVSAKLAPWDYAAADIILAEVGGSSCLRSLDSEPVGLRSRRFHASAGNAELLGEALTLLFGTDHATPNLFLSFNSPNSKANLSISSQSSTTLIQGCFHPLRSAPEGRGGRQSKQEE